MNALVDAGLVRAVGRKVGPYGLSNTEWEACA